jgi:Zn/Cd-binding protein ZinT
LKKNGEQSYSALNTKATKSDKDTDKYVFAGIFTDKNIEAGLLYGYFNWTGARQSVEETLSYKTKSHVLSLKPKSNSVQLLFKRSYLCFRQNGGI